MNMSVSTLPRPRVDAVRVLDIAAWLGLASSNETVVTGASLDSRRLQAGDVWWALPGATHHAMEFVAQAVAIGIVAIVTDAEGARIAREIVTLPASVELLVVNDVRSSAGPVLSRLFGSPSDAMTMVGVTGTNGKTSVTHYLLDAWRAGDSTSDCAVLGTLGLVAPSHPDVEGATGFTTPEADVLQSWLAVLADRHVRAVAMEVSSHALQLHRVDGTTFDVVVFTNLSQDHLDLHGTMSNYFAAKARLFTAEFADRAVICIDDEWGRAMVEHAREAGLIVITYGFGASDWRITRCEFPDCQVDVAGRHLQLRMPAMGAFTATNVVAAAAALHASGIALADVQRMMEKVTAVPGRMEPVAVRQHQPRVIVDYAHSPSAIETVLAAARSDQGALIAVLGAGGDRDRDKRPLMGAAASLADIVVLTDDNPRSEDPSTIREQIRRGVRATRCEEIADRSEAIHWAIAQATADDTVVILGKGAEVGQTYGHETRPFDDRTHAAAALSQWGSQ